MNEADRNSPQINPDIQETAQKLFSEISQLIDAAKQRANYFKQNSNKRSPQHVSDYQHQNRIDMFCGDRWM